MADFFFKIPYSDWLKHLELPSLASVKASAIKVASKLPFADDVVALYFCAIDDDVPFKIKASIGAALAYLVLPVDAIPDFLLGIGFTDDVAVLTALYAVVSGHVSDKHREQARSALSIQQEPVSPVTEVK